ncbi:hypothetical protein [Paractinoplanes globisporus]|uniref:Uncharacterized protein n=1 Tax=Paractinoplanes globisporus TaxID=113565 RepID=A0ABW6WUR5_9ACTN|nr:hypothetical protein [Actinoplanes globisporus]
MSTFTLALPLTFNGRAATVSPAALLPPAAASRAGLVAERERVWLLGLDAATGRFRPNESETAVLIETTLGVRLTRAPRWSRADWFDQYGVSYDAVGPFAAGRFDQQWRRFSEQILLHLRKADIVPVDVSLFTRAQAETVESFIGGHRLGPRVFTLGHTWLR